MLLLLALLSFAEAQPSPESAPMTFHGNVVLPDSVYLAALELPHNTVASESLARTVQRKLRSFLRRSGYDLSSVEATYDGKNVVVEIDEGQLDKIVFLGEGVVETVRLKLELELPGRIFNRDLVDRRLAEIAKASHFRSWRWELVPVESAPLPSAQLDDLSILRGLPFLQPGRPYDLFIYVTPQADHPGWSPEIEVDSLEGGGVGAEYHARRGLSFGGRIAGAVRDYLRIPGSRIVLTRGWLEARYAGPHLWGAGPQAFLRGRFDYLNRQRGDLMLETYQQIAPSVKGSLEQQVGTYARFSVGVGAVRRFLFGFDTVGQLPATVQDTPKAENRLFGDLSLDLDFSPNEARRDKHDTVSLGVRFLPSVQQGIPAATYTNFSAQYVTPIGWHEAWLRMNGTALTGFVPFTDEESLGAHVHGPFGSVFTRKLVTVGGEFRYSLWRDVFKVGPYVEAVVFGNIDRTTNRQSPLVGAVAGAMASGLFFDQFVFETYFGLGSMTDGHSELGLSLAIRQAY